MGCRMMSAAELREEQKIVSYIWEMLQGRRAKDTFPEASCVEKIRSAGISKWSRSLSESLLRAVMEYEKALPPGSPGYPEEEWAVLSQLWEAVKAYSAITQDDDDSWESCLVVSEQIYRTGAGLPVECLAHEASFALMSYLEVRCS